MTKRVDRLMEIGVVGYIVVSITQVLLEGPSPAPQWVVSITQLLLGG